MLHFVTVRGFGTVVMAMHGIHAMCMRRRDRALRGLDQWQQSCCNIEKIFGNVLLSWVLLLITIVNREVKSAQHNALQVPNLAGHSLDLGQLHPILCPRGSDHLLQFNDTKAEFFQEQHINLAQGWDLGNKL